MKQTLWLAANTAWDVLKELDMGQLQQLADKRELECG